MSSPGHNISSKTIVIVEDDDEVRRSLCMLLGSRGLNVTSYRSSEELLEKGTPPDADCLLVDYKMGKQNGLDLLKHLRAIGITTPALMITGFFSNNLLQLAHDAGYYSVIEKPPAANQLIKTLQSCISA